MITKFVEHEEKVVRNAAIMILGLKEEVEAGNLTIGEFEELAGDIVDLERIAQRASAIQDKALVEKAFTQIKQGLPGIIKGLVSQVL